MKNIISIFNFKSCFFTIFLALLFVGFSWVPQPVFSLVDVAVAGRGRASHHHRHRVARRTTRRVTRAIVVGTRVTVLPRGCTTIMRNGHTHHYCGGVYYRPYYEGTTIVYVVVD